MKPTREHNQGRLKGILDTFDLGRPCAPLSDAALRVLEARYLLRDAQGNITETPSALFSRVARCLAQVEAKWWKSGQRGFKRREDRVEFYAERFFDLMSSLKFLPNSPTLMNAGKPRGQLSACFVLPLEDDLRRVFDTLRDSAIIHKTGGGTGFNFGQLRPKGDVIEGSGGTASGPMAFLKIFDTATQTVKQGGVRRGANMAILPIDHPDILEFITLKASGGIENFNMSVGVSDKFMTALRESKSWDLINPRTKKTVKNISAKKLWDLIAESAWKSGDPGVVFLDEINRKNPTPHIGAMDSTNPCGEQPLLPYESCNLGSMNLLPYVNEKNLQWAELEKDIETAIRMLDNVIDGNSYPLIEIEEITMLNRKIGLGIMGWADVLIHWGIPYDSEEALNRADEVMSKISKIAIRASEKLADERGPFPAFKNSIWAKDGQKSRRNATVTTVAPTGTISIIAGVSSGIEPIFSLAHERRALGGETMVFLHPALKEALIRNGIRDKKTIESTIASGSVSNAKKLPPQERRILRTAMEIAPVWHVRMQAVFQEHTENGVSKTINLPQKAKFQEVRKIFELAYDLGCKGITVFRDQSKPEQVLRAGIAATQKTDKKQDIFHAIDWLLDDGKSSTSNRKKASLGLANLSRAQLKKQKKR